MSLLALLPAMASSADKTDFRVNDDGGSVDQNHPRIALSGDGSFAVIWADMRNGQSDIYLQRFGPDWEPIDINRKLNDDTAGAHQSEPVIAADLFGRFSAVWTDYRDGSFPFGPREYFQRLDSAMKNIGGNRNLTVSAPDSLKESPDIALSDFGDGVAVWADFRNRRWDIYAQRFAPDGSGIGDNIIVNTSTAGGQQHSPRVAISPEGWYVVTWYGNRLGNDDIWMQMFDSAGNVVGQNIRVNSDGEQVRQAFPDVAADGAGHFTVVWIDWRNGGSPGDPDIYSRRFSSNLLPLTVDTRVSRDISGRAQRQPTISADRKGNVGIIWADSAKGSWDITGQMIDVEGMIREANFQANSFSDSSQVQPDVALDGRYRYVVWSDKRNGDFDIYASITLYNDPRLIPTPPFMEFIMDVSGSPPPAQWLLIDHAGFNPLTYQVLSTANWLNVSPSAGTTPDSISVSVLPSGLGLGTYDASLVLLDTVNVDSSVVPVRFTVSTPTMAISDDSLVFRAFAGLDYQLRKTVQIANSGIGQFNWTATSGASWLSPGQSSGLSDSALAIFVNAAGLVAGDYTDLLLIQSPNAVGSPDSIVVTARVVDDQPYLLVTPDSLIMVTNRPEAVSAQVTVGNAGIGSINWTASVSDSWLIADILAGADGDTIELTLDPTLLPPGNYQSLITIVDSGSFNISQSVRVYAQILESSADTIQFGSTKVQLLGIGSIPISLALSQSLSFLVLPLSIDSSILILDSVVPGINLPSYANVTLVKEATAGQYILSMNTLPVDSTIPAGNYEFGELFFTAGQIDTLIAMDAVFLDTLRPNLGPGSGAAVTPVILPGEITIGTLSDVKGDENSSLPSAYKLEQNYPNPFNPTTTISFELPKRSDIRLELFNLLGQQVSLIASGAYSAGEHVVIWNGAKSASGVYFYRLRAEGVSIVRKMILLK